MSTMLPTEYVRTAEYRALKGTIAREKALRLLHHIRRGDTITEAARVMKRRASTLIMFMEDNELWYLKETWFQVKALLGNTNYESAIWMCKLCAAADAGFMKQIDIDRLSGMSRAGLARSRIRYQPYGAVEALEYFLYEIYDEDEAENELCLFLEELSAASNTSIDEIRDCSLAIGVANLRKSTRKNLRQKLSKKTQFDFSK